MRRKVYSEKRQLKLTPLEHFLFENYFSHSYIDSFIHLAVSLLLVQSLEIKEIEYIELVFKEIAI